MKVGSFVFATDQGLGYLAKSFYDNDVVTDVIMVQHGSRENHVDWYPGATILPASKLKIMHAKEFVREMDVMFFFETPFDWNILEFCREVGTKTVLMPMHECTPKILPQTPDVFLCPSALELGLFGGSFIPVPVGVPWSERRVAKRFVHNAGNGGLLGRNGTDVVVKAMEYIESDAEIVIRSQEKIVGLDQEPEHVPADQLYDGDVFLFPEKFDGLSLPLQEAFASGMLVMALDRYPVNTWLPRGPLLQVERYESNSIAKGFYEFDEAIVSPKNVARWIDSWYGQEIGDFSMMGKWWGQQNSWVELRPKYIEFLEAIE